MYGFNQAQAHAQFVANVVDFDMNIQAAMDAARFNKDNSGCGVNMRAAIRLRRLKSCMCEGTR